MCNSASLRVLVTGASGGIGRATCMALLESAQSRDLQLKIAVAASKPGPTLQLLVEELQTAGAQATGLIADLADAGACERLAQQAISACDGLDVLVSNAGLVRPQALATLAVADWDLVFEVDARATWLLARSAYKALAESRGAIVAVGSVSGLIPFPGLGAYSPAKAALIMLCRQLAQEWAADGIRVNTVSPGLVRTPLTEPVYSDEKVLQQRIAAVPLGRIGTPEDVAKAIIFLCGPGADYVTGIDMRLDGGMCDHNLGKIPGKPRSQNA